MNSKKAKLLRKLAVRFVIQTQKPFEEVSKEYRKIKKSYKSAKGHL